MDLMSLITGMTGVDLIFTLLGQLLLSFLQNVIAPLATQLFVWELDYTQVPYVNTVILWLQAFAAIAVVAVRVAIGIKDKILLGGGDNEISASEYIFKSIAAVVVVALMPTLCSIIIRFGHTMFVDITGGSAGSLADQVAFFSMGDKSFTESLGDAVWTAHAGNMFWIIMGVIAISVLTFGCGYQFLKRQVEMVTISIIGPIVSIYAATENDTDQVMNLLKNLFGLCCVQWLQYVLVSIALGVGEGWVTAMLTNTTYLENGPFSTAEMTQIFLYTIAWFGAALTVPALVDNYTYGNGGSKAGNAAVGAIVNMGMRTPRTVLKGTGSVVRTTARTVTRAVK